MYSTLSMDGHKSKKRFITNGSDVTKSFKTGLPEDHHWSLAGPPLVCILSKKARCGWRSQYETAFSITYYWETPLYRTVAPQGCVQSLTAFPKTILQSSVSFVTLTDLYREGRRNSWLSGAIITTRSWTRSKAAEIWAALNWTELGHTHAV